MPTHACNLPPAVKYATSPEDEAFFISPPVKYTCEKTYILDGVPGGVTVPSVACRGTATFRYLVEFGCDFFTNSEHLKPPLRTTATTRTLSTASSWLRPWDHCGCSTFFAERLQGALWLLIPTTMQP